MNPIEAIKLLSGWHKLQSIVSKKGTTMSKVPQITLLVVSLFGVIGLPNLAANWVHAHFVFYLAFVVAAIVLHAIFPSIFAAPSDADKKATGFSGSAAILFLLAIGSLALTVPARAQISGPFQAPPTSVANLYVGGVSYSAGATPAVAGSALYAHAISPDSVPGMYAFSMIDILPATKKPFTVTTNIGAGIAQKVFTIDGVDVFIPTSAGISLNGTNVGWAWSTGAGAPIKFKPTKDGGSWYLMPTVRVLKSSVSGGTGYQPIFGLLVGWGK